MIALDGAQGEGGGQILRSALSLSMITGQPFTITSIRAGRAKPGLLRQHLTAVKAATEVPDADCVVVFAGTNDFCGGVPIGEFFTEHKEEVVVLRDANGKPLRTEIRRKREFVFSEETFCGRMNRVFSFLKTKFYDKRIIVMTPLHRAYAEFAPDNIQYDELYSNSAGLFLEDYVAAIRKAADVWSLNLIDLYRDGGLFPLIGGYGRYFANEKTDRLHPSAEGHKRIAAVICEKLSVIPTP